MWSISGTREDYHESNDSRNDAILYCHPVERSDVGIYLCVYVEEKE